MKRLLLTSVCRPLGPAYGDGQSVGYELLFGQVTRAQGLFSPRANHVQFSLEYIAQNVDAPTTVLQYPSRRELVRELKKGYDFIGLAFILATFHRMKEVVALVRKHAPRTKIILGGYGTLAGDEELKPYADHICRGEGVAFMRDLLGEAPRPMPYEHPMIVSRLKIFSIPAARTGMVFAGLGCPNGCDFCATSHFFKRRHIRLLPTGKDIYDVLCRYQDTMNVGSFTIIDEDFLLNKKRAMELRRSVLEGGRTFSIFAFASVRAVSQYTPEELLEMGVDGLWIGYEGTRSGYDKQKGVRPSDLFPELTRNGILVLASMIVGFDYQDPDVIADELRGLMRLRPALSQFLIYGPPLGTPLYARMKKERRLRPDIFGDREKFFRNCTGFTSAITHSKMTYAEIERLQRWCFEQDTRRLGPSIYRASRVWLNGCAHLRRSPRAALRRKSLAMGREVRRIYPLFLAGRLLGPNRRIRRWTAAFERRAHRELGAPGLLDRALSVLALGAALWTRLTLSLNWFQHPHIRPSRYRWEQLPGTLMRLWGDIRESGTASELRVLLDRRAADGLSWILLEGALDGKSAAELGRRVREALERGKERFVISLEKLQSIDREGLAEFYRAFRKYRDSVCVIPPVSLPSGAPDLRGLAEYFVSAAQWRLSRPRRAPAHG
ncbi:MAG: hypothetical protein ABII00_07160 [Elusimicrobiota bacterium]